MAWSLFHRKTTNRKKLLFEINLTSSQHFIDICSLVENNPWKNAMAGTKAK